MIRLTKWSLFAPILLTIHRAVARAAPAQRKYFLFKFELVIRLTHSPQQGGLVFTVHTLQSVAPLPTGVWSPPVLPPGTSPRETVASLLFPSGLSRGVLGGRSPPNHWAGGPVGWITPRIEANLNWFPVNLLKMRSPSSLCPAFLIFLTEIDSNLTKKRSSVLNLWSPRGDQPQVDLDPSS